MPADASGGKASTRRRRPKRLRFAPRLLEGRGGAAIDDRDGPSDRLRARGSVRHLERQTR